MRKIVEYIQRDRRYKDNNNHKLSANSVYIIYQLGNQAFSVLEAKLFGKVVSRILMKKFKK